MAAGFVVPGPCYIQVGTGASGALQHLGWSETGVRIEPNAEFEDVICDLGGGKIGTDFLYLGQDAIITADLNKYDEAVLSALSARTQGGTTGAIGAGSIGSLMLGQNLTQRLLIVSTYTAAYTNMVPAYNFPTTYVMGPIGIEVGSKVKKARIQWRAVVALAVSGGLASGTLYNNSTSGVAAIT